MTRGVTLAALAHAAVLGSATACAAGAIYYSTWQGFTTCSSPGGYSSTESRWRGVTTGQDSAPSFSYGRRWTTSRWRDTTTTTVEPPPER